MTATATRTLTMVQAVQDALGQAMEQDDSVMLFGEDVGMGGVFRASDGLQARFGKDRVFDTPLSEAGEPTLEQTGTGKTPPGFQQVVDFDGDGKQDGILVGETIYGGDWWASNGSSQFVKDGAPSHAPGSGSTNHGTLDQWRQAFPNAQVKAFGFSLGSGVYGDWTINAINFAGTRYTFAADVKLASKEECKNGSWATSNLPTYRNQGECVSSFASAK